MKTISLTQGKVALVDDEDFEKLNKHKWHVQKSKNTFYAVRNVNLGNGKFKGYKMHRVLLGITDSNIEIDHRDHNGLNNQKHNLRACTDSKNQWNAKKRKDACQYKGITFHKHIKKWQVQIQCNGKHIHIGYFTSDREAARAYDVAARKYFGEFAHCNFI